MKNDVESGYVPPFTVNAEITNLVIDIPQVMGHLSATTNKILEPQLRKQNRIRTIQSSLAIENNSLTLEQVTAILNGKRVLGAPNEIREVKNAIDAYNLLWELNPFMESDLLRAHRLTMSDLVNECGRYRSSGVGVFGNGRVIHVAPPAWRAPKLVADLLEWVKTTKLHALVSSCVFHYEFEFIHSFDDGNGRMGCMWQTLLLMQWDFVFAWLPVETIVKNHQQTYYDVIAECDCNGDSTAFVTFMLDCLRSCLLEFQESNQKSNRKSNRKILRALHQNPALTIKELEESTRLSESGVKKVIRQLREGGLIRRVGPNKGGHWKVIDK